VVTNQGAKGYSGKNEDDSLQKSSREGPWKRSTEKRAKEDEMEYEELISTSIESALADGI